MKQAELKGKEPISYAVRIQKFRDSLNEKENYFISEEYMAKVTRSMDLMDYQRLFTRSGFMELFLKDYWITHDSILANIKTKFQKCQKSLNNSDGFKGQSTNNFSNFSNFEETSQYIILVLRESFYVLQKVLALRLDSLFKFEDHKSK